MATHLYFTYQGADTAKPGLPGEGASIAVTFSTGTLELDDDTFIVFYGVLGDEAMAAAYVAPNGLTCDGNLNSFYSEFAVDAGGAPLKGRMTSSIKLAFPVWVAIIGTDKYIVLPPAKTSVDFVLDPGSTAAPPEPPPPALPAAVQKSVARRKGAGR